MDPKRKIVIAEDHTILRESLRAILADEETVTVVGEASNGLEAIRSIEHLEPDLLLLDLAMPKMSGIAALKDIKTRYPGTKILILTVQKSEEYILAAFEAGADGYCLKSATYNELATAIKTVLAGKTFMSAEVSSQVLVGYLEGRKRIKTKSSWDTLTQREREILKMIGEGHKNTEIAEFLCISVKTVEKHRSNIMKKLDLHSASALTAYAIEKGLVVTR